MVGAARRPTIPLGPASMAGNFRPVALQQVWGGVAGIGGTCPGIFCFTASPRGTIRGMLVVAECLLTFVVVAAKTAVIRIGGIQA